MDQNQLTSPQTVSKTPKQKEMRKILGVFFVLSCLVILGIFTYINYKNTERNEQTSKYLQKGMQLRNGYETLKVTRIKGTSYSQFPHRLLEIHAYENTLYSYRDDFYKDYSEPSITLDRNKIVIYLTQRQVFDNPTAVAKQPECEAMARIESQKRNPELYENEPAEIKLKYQDKRDSNEKVYIYTPKLGHCKQVFSDNQLLKVQGDATSIRYSF